MAVQTVSKEFWEQYRQEFSACYPEVVVLEKDDGVVLDGMLIVTGKLSI